MDPHRFVQIAYAAMDFCNPVSAETIDRALGAARLPAATRTLDLGCGNAAMSVHMAERFGLEIDAIERSPAIFDIAKARVAGLTGPGAVRLHNVESRDFLAEASPYDLIVCAGASIVVPGSHEPEDILATLARHTRPGGFILWADPYWIGEPSPQLKAMVGPYASYRPHAGNIAAGEGAGLACWYAATSTVQDWDHYSWSLDAAARAWLVANPDHPDAESVRQRADFGRGMYLQFGRDALGFGVYLFRKP